MMKDAVTVQVFPIDYVIDLDLAKTGEFRTYPAPVGYSIDCPFCAGKRKMNVNTEKNVVRCAKCTKAFNSITLHAALTHTSNSEAYKDLVANWKGLAFDKKKVFINTVSEPTFKLYPADIKIRDCFYRLLLNELTLSKKHHDDLIKRGLTEQEIKKGLYKTVPVCGFQTFARKILLKSQYSKADFEDKFGVPGFYDLGTDYPKLVGRKNGYFVPVYTIDHKISGLQIRYDNLPKDATDEQKERYHKYSWFSSSEKETGCAVTGCENIHFAGDWSSYNGEPICLTEGVLKADIAAALSGKQFIGLVGVNNVGQLKNVLLNLKSMGLNRISIMVDMDYRDKVEVKAALDSIIDIISKCEIDYTPVTWLPEYKGIDDFLLARLKFKGITRR